MYRENESKHMWLQRIHVYSCLLPRNSTSMCQCSNESPDLLMHFFTQFQLPKHETDEFIKERERYATIGDDLDLAFVGQQIDILILVQWMISRGKSNGILIISNYAELIGVEMVYNDRHPKPPTPIKPKSPTPPPKEPTPPGTAHRTIHLIDQIRCTCVHMLILDFFFRSKKILFRFF